MKVTRFNRVELLLPAEDLEAAVRVFNDVLGGSIEPPHLIEDQQVLTTVDYALGIELMAPGGPDSRLNASLARKGRGGIGPLVWEVDDLDATKAELVEKGYRIFFEYEGEGVRQLHLDPDQLFGYGVTFTQRH